MPTDNQQWPDWCLILLTGWDFPLIGCCLFFWQLSHLRLHTKAMLDSRVNSKVPAVRLWFLHVYIIWNWNYILLRVKWCRSTTKNLPSSPVRSKLNLMVIIFWLWFLLPWSSGKWIIWVGYGLLEVKGIFS